MLRLLYPGYQTLLFHIIMSLIPRVLFLYFPVNDIEASKALDVSCFVLPGEANLFTYSILYSCKKRAAIGFSLENCLF